MYQYMADFHEHVRLGKSAPGKGAKAA
jgi:hypothetical protein